MRLLRRIQSIAGLFVFLAAFSVYAQDAGFLASQPPGDKPMEVFMGFNLVNITDVSEKEETISFDGALYLEWKDTRLAYDLAEHGMSADWVPGDYLRSPSHIYQGDYAVKELFLGWRPHILIANGIGNRMITNMAISIWPDGWVAYSETFDAVVETPMDLRRFPFDIQQLEVFFHPFIYQRDEIVLVPDNRLARTWNQNLGIADWSRESVEVKERAINITYFDDSLSEISEVVVAVKIQRRPAHFLISIIFPMILLVSLTWCVFWMNNESLSNRVNITFIGILSVIAYYFVILDSVPEASYLTLVDAFIISTFLIMAAGVILGVAVDTLNNSGRTGLSARVDRICRWTFPLAYMVITSTLGFVFFNI